MASKTAKTDKLVQEAPPKPENAGGKSNKEPELISGKLSE